MGRLEELKIIAIVISNFHIPDDIVNLFLLRMDRQRVIIQRCVVAFLHEKVSG